MHSRAVLFVTRMYGKVSLQLMGTPPIQMANLGMADSLILMVMALVVFGPRRLPQIGRQIGKLMYEFRKASNDFKFQMDEELRNAEEADRRKKEEERQRALSPTAPAQPALPEVVSQVSEARPGAPAANSTTESPYPDEGVYPATIETTAEAPAEETYARIQPPSVGEQVAAARPSNLTALARSAKEQGAAAGAEADAAANPESSAAEAMVSEGAPAEPGASEPESSPVEPEQAAHHG
jgi:sec-independent protein translocase protein TatB